MQNHPLTAEERLRMTNGIGKRLGLTPAQLDALEQKFLAIRQLCLDQGKFDVTIDPLGKWVIRLLPAVQGNPSYVIIFTLDELYQKTQRALCRSTADSLRKG